MLLLETERLLIKVSTLADIDNWHSLHSDPEVMQYIDVLTLDVLFRNGLSKILLTRLNTASV